MKTKEWIESIIRNPRPLAVPIMTHPGIELTGRKVREAVTDGQIHYEAIKAVCDRFPNAEASTTIMDLTVEAEAFGAEIYFADDEVPTVTGRLVSSPEEVESLAVPSLNQGRIQEYLKADALAAQNIDKPVFAGCIGPFSLAGRLYGMTEIMMGIFTEPETVRLLLEKCTAFIVKYISAIKQTGVAGVIIAEPASGLLSNDDCLCYSSVYVKQIVDQFQDDNFAIVLHNCGNSGNCTPAMVYTGAKMLHFGNNSDLSDVVEMCPPDVMVMGNIDPVGVLKNSTPDQVEKAARDLIAKMSAYPNFVLSSGCDTPPNVPFENIDAFFRALDD